MAPTNPPSDATNLTAATLYAALKAGDPTKFIYAYSSPTSQAPGFGADAAEALLNVPGAATALTAVTLAAELSAPGTDHLFVFKSATDTRSPGFTSAAAEAQMRDSFDPYGGQPVYRTRVEFQQGARVYGSADLTDPTGTILAVDTELVVYRAATRTNAQLFFQVAAGAQIGNFVKFEEIRLPDSSL